MEISDFALFTNDLLCASKSAKIRTLPREGHSMALSPDLNGQDFVDVLTSLASEYEMLRRLFEEDHPAGVRTGRTLAFWKLLGHVSGEDGLRSELEIRKLEFQGQKVKVQATKRSAHAGYPAGDDAGPRLCDRKPRRGRRSQSARVAS